MESPKKHHIVIVGGGFAAVDVAKYLQRRIPPDWEVLLYSKENHFVMTPLLPELMGGAVHPRNAVRPIRQMTKHVSVRTARVVSLDLKASEVVYQGARHELERQPYDQLVLAIGLKVDMTRIPGLSTFGWPIKIMGDALVLGNHVVQQLELAQLESDPKERTRLLSFAVIGGGFTGIEVAGEMTDFLQQSVRYYDRINPQDIRVTVLEHGSRILRPMPESLSAFAERKMKKQGIHIIKEVSVEAVSQDGVHLKGGEFVQASTVISAVGNAAHTFVQQANLPVERDRIKVRGDMRVEGVDNVWALGDCAAVPNAFDNTVCPELAQFAVRQAKQLGKNLISVIGGKSTHPFRYKSRGMFAVIGHHNAVGNPFGVRLSGWLAFVMWYGIYWAMTPTFGRKMQIAFDWLMGAFLPPDLTEISLERTRRRAPQSSDEPGEQEDKVVH
jgi:NADH:quinone reductase (non-electrogenic)